MRVHLREDSNTVHFSELLLKIVNGKHQESERKVTLPIGLGTVVNTLKIL